MLSRALSLAAVTLLIGCLPAATAQAQNLEAGKSPSQIFSSTCTACHKSPRGLLKTVPASSLPGFLRQHYTTSSDMAGVLASYLISNGANDPRYQAKDQPKGAKDGRHEARQSPEQAERPGPRQHPGAAPQEAARPDADGLTPGEGHPHRRGKRMARPSEAPEGVRPVEGEPPAAGEGKPSRHKLGRRGKPVEEKPGEAAKGETPNDEPRAARRQEKGESEKPANAKPVSDKSDSAKADAPKEATGSESTPLRSDPVPPVTPAPAAAPSPSPAPAAAAPAPSPAAAASPAPASAAPPATAAAPAPTPAGSSEAPVSK
ncbi:MULTISPECIES: hypothetical protein [unclassified Bradyrhizobium]|uniref:hypothetical protein n=1 Tax=unclassified Bradyrhizobium TaxID=2631580 RepID=UPI002479C82B|nr:MULTISPECIES: hypothetical protein [unclassified Bradyrhizobium]WGS17716.1 hypothetical protein MTX22_24155 [Bradyrhizobium sp. ISRA463]WGS24510.1 hypothetical protein MTX19_21820 [Bradyrhizobium sp. ISRA464]